MSFWKPKNPPKNLKQDLPKMTLRNMLIISMYDGSSYRQWYDGWEKTEDPRAPWKPLYDWFLNETTPFFVMNGDLDPFEHPKMSLDYILRREEIRTIEFSLTEVESKDEN